MDIAHDKSGRGMESPKEESEGRTSEVTNDTSRPPKEHAVCATSIAASLPPKDHENGHPISAACVAPPPLLPLGGNASSAGTIPALAPTTASPPYEIPREESQTPESAAKAPPPPTMGAAPPPQDPTPPLTHQPYAAPPLPPPPVAAATLPAASAAPNAAPVMAAPAAAAAATAVARAGAAGTAPVTPASRAAAGLPPGTAEAPVSSSSSSSFSGSSTTTTAAFDMAGLRAQLNSSQVAERLTNHVWNSAADSWIQPPHRPPAAAATPSPQAASLPQPRPPPHEPPGGAVPAAATAREGASPPQVTMEIDTAGTATTAEAPAPQLSPTSPPSREAPLSPSTATALPQPQPPAPASPLPPTAPSPTKQPTSPGASSPPSPPTVVDPAMVAAAQDLLAVLQPESDATVLLKRARYGLETKNRLVDRLREEVDLFMMTPECTLALDALDALKEQLDFHYQRINQHVASFADARLKALPLGGPATQPLCISTWAQCVGYELLCELLNSLVKELEKLRLDCAAQQASATARAFPPPPPQSPLLQQQQQRQQQPPLLSQQVGGNAFSAGLSPRAPLPPVMGSGSNGDRLGGSLGGQPSQPPGVAAVGAPGGSGGGIHLGYGSSGLGSLGGYGGGGDPGSGGSTGTAGPSGGGSTPGGAVGFDPSSYASLYEPGAYDDMDLFGTLGGNSDGSMVPSGPSSSSSSSSSTTTTGGAVRGGVPGSAYLDGGGGARRDDSSSSSGKRSMSVGELGYGDGGLFGHDRRSSSSRQLPPHRDRALTGGRDHSASPRSARSSSGGGLGGPSPRSAGSGGGQFDGRIGSGDSGSGRPKRTAAVVSSRLLSSSSLDPDDSDYEEDEHGTRKKSKFRAALPQDARAHLDMWLSSHWHDPYPTPEEKQGLADKCYITVDQVNHWFINARVRRWRPTMEKAATKAKFTGSGAFAALVKDCGDANPFSKFLGPSDGQAGVSPGGGGGLGSGGGGGGSNVGRPAGVSTGGGSGGGNNPPPSSTLMPGSHLGSRMHGVSGGNSNNNSHSGGSGGNPFGGNFGDYGGGDGLTPGYHDDGLGDNSFHSARASHAASRAAYEMDLRIQRI